MRIIERLERATEGSRELDAQIWCAVQGFTFVGITHDKIAYFLPPATMNTHFSPNAIRFTTSIDAALPDENIVQVKRLTVGHPDGDMWEAVNYPGGPEYTATAHTEALARRIAALKAREKEGK